VDRDHSGARTLAPGVTSRIGPRIHDGTFDGISGGVQVFREAIRPSAAFLNTLTNPCALILRDGANTPRLLRMTGEGRRPLTLRKEDPVSSPAHPEEAQRAVSKEIWRLETQVPFTLRRRGGVAPSRRIEGLS